MFQRILPIIYHTRSWLLRTALALHKHWLLEKRNSNIILKALLLLWQVTSIVATGLFQALGRWGRAKTSEKKKNDGGLRRRALVLPYFFSRSPFFRSQLPRAWNRLGNNKRATLYTRRLSKVRFEDITVRRKFEERRTE